jgi:hypothetical protein
MRESGDTAAALTARLPNVNLSLSFQNNSHQRNFLTRRYGKQ